MKDWDNFGDNDVIDSMFEETPSTSQNGQPIEPCAGTEGRVNEYPVKKVKRGRKPKSGEDGPLTEYRSAKYTESQIQKLKMIKSALSTTNDGEALRWALDAAYKANKRNIERIAEEKKKIGVL
jgi:hypothetical protein